MKKLSSIFVALLVILSAVIVPAVPTAQAADEITAVVVPSDPCGVGAPTYPVINQYVVVEWICTYTGHDQSVTNRVTAKITPCFVMNQSTCRNTTPRITNWVKPQDVPSYAGQLTTTVALGVMDNNPLYQICMANILFFGAQAKGFDGGMSEQAMIDRKSVV